MSIGALSPEAHEALAEAMKASAVTQTPAKAVKTRRAMAQQSVAHQAGSVRSLRRYSGVLVNADVIQIKVAQGAKPGEGVSYRVIKSLLTLPNCAIRCRRDADLPAAAPRYLLY